MPVPPLNPKGGDARLIAGKVRDDDAEWIDSLIEHSGPGTSASAVLRRVITLARKHEEELLEVS
jgi:hypothetical protein